MAQRLFKVTREFTARIPDQTGSKQLIKAGSELWADPDQNSSRMRFYIDYLEFEVDIASFTVSTQLKNANH